MSIQNKNNNKYFQYTINVESGTKVGKYPIPNIKPLESLREAMQHYRFNPLLCNIGIKFYADSNIGVADIDYPFESDAAQSIMRYMPCVPCISRGGNAHAFVRISQSMKGKHGRLRDAYGKILKHPVKPKKKTELKIFSHSDELACNLGLESLIEGNPTDNEIDAYENWFINSLDTLPVADSYLLEVLKHNYPEPPKLPSKPPKTPRITQNSARRGNFSLSDNIDYLQDKIIARSDDCSADFNIYAIFIGSTLARSGNLSFENLEYAMNELVPETYNGEYSRQYKKYTPSHQQKMIDSAMSQIDGGV